MKLVALGLLAALLGAGCAFDAGDPAGTRIGEVAANPTATASTGAAPSPSAAPPSTADEGIRREYNPEPSPWHAVTPGAAVEPAATAVAGSAQSSGRTSAGGYHEVSR
jgi:hypothetical protein